MLIACWSPKGGSGTTVVSCGLAVLLSRTARTIIADLAGDVPAVLGLADPPGPGLFDWLGAGTDVPADSLARLEVAVNDDLRLLPSGLAARYPALTSGRGQALAEALHAPDRPVVVDCGRVDVADTLAVAAAADLSLLVLRPCYLALRAALAVPLRPTGVVLINEPGRALGRRDIEDILGVPVRAVLEQDPAVARAVDAGLLARRVPRSLERALKDAA